MYVLPIYCFVKGELEQAGLWRRLLGAQISLVAAIRLIIAPPIHADHLKRDSVAVHLYQHVMISAVAGLIGRLGDAVKRDLLAVVVLDVLARVGVACVSVERRAASSREDVIEPVFAGLVFIALDPMLEEMIVAREEDSDVMFSEERHVSLPNYRGRRLDPRPAVRP